MSLVVGWLVFPTVLVVLTLGCGLAMERATRTRLPGTLLIPAGLAVIVVAGTLATMTDTTAGFAAPLVVIIAAAGLAISPPWEQRARFDVWALGAAAGVFAVFAAPVVLSGHATFAGYIKLDDTASWAAITEHVMSHGRTVAGLAPSSHEAALDFYLNRGYPIGSLVPLGIGARILGQDALWLVQPWLSLIAASLSMTLNALLSGVVSSRRIRALCAFVAAQPALLFGYAMWGGIKELATAWIVAFTAAVATLAIRERGFGGLVWLGLGSSGTLAVGSFASGVWIVPALVVALGATVRRPDARTLRFAGAFVVLGVMLALPGVVLAHSFLTKFGWHGNLFTHAVTPQLPKPISLLELLGVWPAGDFRMPLSAGNPIRLLILLVAVAALAGIVAAVARRSWELVVYGGATAAIALVLAAVTQPWFAAKALAIGAPAVAALAAAGVAAVWRRGWRKVSGAVGVTILGGVLWSNALAYHAVSLAPRDQIEELQHIGRLAAGQGPTLLTEYNPYGSQHFLGPADGEGISERLQRRSPWLRNRRPAPRLSSVDTDQIDIEGLLNYRTIVLRRTPVASRPPSPYRLIWRGRTYEMWQRPTTFHPLDYHLPLGGAFAAGGRPQCSDVRKLATLAGPGGRLVTVERTTPMVVELGTLSLPADWQASGQDPGIVSPAAKGTVAVTVTIPASGRFDVWVGGSSHGHLTLSVDGVRVGALRGVLNPAGAYMPVGAASLRAGTHVVTITMDDGLLWPGTGGQRYTPLPLGPLVLSPTRAPRGLTVIPPTRWHDLCGKTLDWIEAISRR